SGIMVLAEAEPGTPLGDVLPLVEEVLLVESTGNRPDLLSIYGLAREIAALYDLPLSAMTQGQTPGPVPSGQVDVTVEDFEGCPRYIGRVFRDVSVGQSTVWLRARLTNAGMRPISNVVDVTNYVMLALGNPLHAFDLAKLRGGRIVVRRARPGETIRTLDGIERKLEPEDLMIADAERSVALAGIMGGEETEISDGTSEVLLEAANFEPTGIFRTSERLRLRTEGSNRWEKGVDPYLAEPAADLATKLLAETAGATWAAAADVQQGLPERPVIRYRPERADELIGLATPPEEQLRWLERLGFERGETEVVTPTWRARDVTREVDVIEEVARERLADVPFTLPARRAMFGALTAEQRLRRRIEDLLAGLGLTETYTPSLRPDDQDPRALRLPEPISADFAVLRTSLLPSLVEAARRNVELGAERVALFEVARVYLPAEGLPNEQTHVASIVDGGWSRAKGIVDTLYAALKAEPSFDRVEQDLLHPGKSAATPAGVVGELHPGVLDGVWGAFELDLAKLLEVAREEVRYADVVSFSPVHQDLAFAVPEDVSSAELVTVAREAAGEELRELRPFDVYRGEQVGEGRKSIAFAATFQSPERTLTDEDAAALRERIVTALRDRFGAELRAGA
ncbi:MAG TPA: phenylalanine--tRNA ligase subunit beta, partial [Gaiellaceae bacterium]|nr:phenylalanine--tRNA ligase subunit beta [Gaiellaceae bacterium]